MKKLILAAAVAFAFSAGSVYASGTCDGPGKHAHEKKACCPSKGEHKDAPTMSELKTVTKDELVTMLKTGGVQVFDARTEDQFTEGHVDGAVLFVNATLPEDKATPIVFYCGGTRCPAASKAAKKALDAGYTNVLVFKGGWAEWSANG